MASATKPPPAPDQPSADDGDLLALGLAVFFVSLIGIVAALLILPAVF
jgi:hypothetical protein